MREQQNTEEAKYGIHHRHGHTAAKEQHEEEAQDAQTVIDRQPAIGQHVTKDVAAIQRRQRKKIKCGQKQVQQHTDIKNQSQRISHGA